MFEAEKSKVYDEAEKRVLEERVRKVGKKLSAADDRLNHTKVHKRLLEKEAQSYKDALEEVEQKLEKKSALSLYTAWSVLAMFSLSLSCLVWQIRLRYRRDRRRR